VLTLEADPGQSEALPRDPRVNVVHVPARGQSGWRSAFGGHLQTALEQNLGSKNNTIVHDFGLWLPANHAVVSVCKNLGIPRVCSPCGMLAPWAIRHKAWKKRLAWWAYQRRDLSRATLLAATSEQEVRDIRRLVPGKNVALVPNGVELPEGSGQKSEVGSQRPGTGKQKTESKNKFQLSAFRISAFENVGGRKTAVFLGRIHPVKGLKNLVEAWHLVQPAGWHCILAGPDQAGHRNELEALLRSRNLASIFEFTGMMEDEQKWALLREADLFVLPSFTENFGVAAAEALACGVPVITTKGTPWKDLVDRRCGWWVDIGVEPLAAALREATSLTDQERHEMGQRGRRLVEGKYAWPRIARDLLAVYEWVLGGGAKPECVVKAKTESGKPK
jgi:glycosyltransferase involved in cell wall biosynthesis